VPDEIADAKLHRVLFSGEPINRPGWPMLAQYKTMPQFSQADVNLSCWGRQETPEFSCTGRQEFKTEIAGHPACYYPPDPRDPKDKTTMVSWFVGGWSCSLIFKYQLFAGAGDAKTMAIRAAAGVVAFFRRVPLKAGFTPEAWSAHVANIEAAHHWR